MYDIRVCGTMTYAIQLRVSFIDVLKKCVSVLFVIAKNAPKRKYLCSTSERKETVPI